MEAVEGGDNIRIDGFEVIGLHEGSASIAAVWGESRSNELAISIVDSTLEECRHFELEASGYGIGVGESVELTIDSYPVDFARAATLELRGDVDAFSMEGNLVTAVLPGASVEVIARCGEVESVNSLFLFSFEETPIEFPLRISRRNVEVGSATACRLPDGTPAEGLVLLSGKTDWVDFEDGYLLPKATNRVFMVAEKSRTGLSSPVAISSYDHNVYEGIDEEGKEVFYECFRPAVSNEEAAYRSQEGLLSGWPLTAQSEPPYAEERPVEDGKFIRNSGYSILDYGGGYEVIGPDGLVDFTVFAAGGYVSLSEVAAYIFAFGDVPANYDPDRSSSPRDSIWGEYLRLNNTSFSGDTDNYPYEPVLPDIHGEGGNLRYYEVDIGGGGYNGGTSINRGSQRIVYSRYYADTREPITDLEDRYVFYTYNHYNDFQEYLNYNGGWGERFGKVTAGGRPNEASGPAPSPYVEVVRKNLFLF